MQVCFQEAVKRGFCNSQCNVLNKLHNNRLERWIWVSGLEPLVRFKTDVDMVNLIIFISMYARYKYIYAGYDSFKYT